MAILPVFTGQAQEPTVFTTRLPRTGGYVMADAVMDGKPVRFIVDSGASIIGVDPGAVKMELGIDTTSTLLGEDLTHLRKGRVNHWSLGGISRITDEVVEVDLGLINRHYGLRAAGVIGLRGLGFKYVTLDYDKELLTAGDEAAPGGYAQTLPVRWRKESPEVQATFGPHAVSLLIDTGFSGALDLPAAVYDDLVKTGAIVEKKEQHGRSTSLVKVKARRTGFFTRGELMHLPLAGHEVGRDEGDMGQIGQDWMVLFNSRLTTGYASGRLEYTPRENPAPLPEVALTLGAVFVYENGHVLLERLRPDAAGPMEKAGLKPGDRIVKLGELQEAEISDGGLRAWIPAQAGRKVPCVTVRGDGAPVQSMLHIGELVTSHRHGLEQMAQLQAGKGR
ncbi:MAG: aspartyl protease family protein [Prosthecobacter sp.]